MGSLDYISTGCRFRISTKSLRKGGWFMSSLIKNGQVLSNEWKVLRLGAGVAAQDVNLPVGPVLVPLPVWKARRRELIHREFEHGWALGIWLAADENLQAIEGDIDDFSVIAIEFDKFSDGNG